MRSPQGAVVRRAGRFVAVGVLGLLVNLLVQAALIELLGWNYLIAAVAATQGSSSFNFVLSEAWVFRGIDDAARGHRFISFLAMNNAALVVRAPLMWILVDGLAIHYTIANLASLALLMSVRFTIADRLIWRSRPRRKVRVIAAPLDLAFARTSSPSGMRVAAWASHPREDLHPVTRFFLHAQSAGRSVRTHLARSRHDERDRESIDESIDETLDETLDRPLEEPGDEHAAPIDGACRPVDGDDVWPPPDEGDQVVPSRLTARVQMAALSAILAVGAGLRTWKLVAVGFNSDEAVYASQAAGIAGDQAIAEFFPIFRAHPLLFQAVLSVPYRLGTSDAVGRMASVCFGLGTVIIVFATARRLYGPREGLVAAALVALMPYHVVVTRQVLLDGPMTFFATLSLYFLVRFVQQRQLAWLLCASGSLALTVLAKETYIILVGSFFMFFALNPEVRLRVREILLASVVFVAALLPFPITILLAGKTGTGRSYLSWQLFRRPNHGWSFYPAVLPSYVGFAVLIGALLAIIFTWGIRRSWRERLLLSWIVVPVGFFEIWPVKGFHYLLAAAIPLAILASLGLCLACERLIGLGGWRRLRPEFSAGRRPALIVTLLAVVGVAVSLVIPSWAAVQPATDEAFLAGTGGVPGGREVGEWITDNTPLGAEFMTVGPSMANLVQYYGRRKAYGLSVSPNPLNRNPSYEPIVNPDLAIRTSNLQYLVWDSYSTNRSQFFGDKLRAYAERYHGRSVFSYESEGRPLIIVYEVRP